MNHNPSLDSVGSKASPATSKDSRPGPSSVGTAFRGLLDELQEKTRRLKVDGEELSQPSELAGAVDRARASLDDALSLSGKLLEAYRAAQQVTGSEERQ